MKRRALATSTVMALAMATSAMQPAFALTVVCSQGSNCSPPPPGEAAAALNNAGATAGASDASGHSDWPAKTRGEVNTAAHDDPNEYRVVLDCEPARLSDTPGGERTNCSYGMTVCSYLYPTLSPLHDEIRYRVESRPKKPPNAPWTLVRTMCGLQDLPPGVPPPPQVPTLGQIQTAFKELPFSKPTVSIQPAGNVTLVNLPTYYRATWPNDAGLQPGEISKPVQLLSWSVEFRISSRSYNFHYGDGNSSGPVTDAGGVYPDGTIRHTYDKPFDAAKVAVDSQLTGEYRANGGDWQDIASVADLQNEPVTTLEVKEAKARLVTR
jgi:hypothetical protein